MPESLFCKHTKTKYKRPQFLFEIVLILFMAAGIAHAQVAPQLTSISPRAAQRGQTIDITLEGKNINENAEIWFNKEGITAEIKKKAAAATVRFNGSGISGNIPDNPRLVISFQIAPEAPLGNHQIRLITPNGVSNPQNFIVGDLPEIKEQEPNATPAEANMLELPATVNGVVASIDDIDMFRFKLKKGARLICDINAQRMGSPLDSYIELYDPSGTEVVKSGDGNGLDSFIDYTTEQAGEYTLYLRDIRYQGGGNYLYRLNIGELPYLQSVFPLGGKRGAANNVNVAGANLGSVNAIQLDISPDASLGIQQLRVSTPSGLETNPYPYAIGEFNEANETEPNNALAEENKIGTPITVNGKIEKAGDVDRYSIKVEKGARFVFEVKAREFRSELDPLLTIYSHKKGEAEDSVEEQVLSVNDDASGVDAIVAFTFPEAGDYGISVRDLNDAGGGDYPYRLTIRPLNPGFRVNISTDNPRISRGGTLMLTVSAARVDGFNGALRFYSPDLPKGFVVSPTILYAGQNQGLLTITAPSDAALGLHPFSIVGVGAVGGRRIEETASPKEILLTVMEAPPFTLSFADVDINVVHNKSTNFHVIADRQDGFKGPIALTVQGMPVRISGGKATIPAGQNSTVISLRAGTVERREQFSVVPTPGTSYISVSGTANINRESFTESTPAIPLTVVEAPFIVTIEPLRFSIVFPKQASETEAAAAGQDGVVAVSNPSPTEKSEQTPETAEKSEPIKKSAKLTMSIVRRGSFTDFVTIKPITVPEGITVPEATIPMNENDVEVDLEALSSLEPKTYQVKFRATAVINGKAFVQDSPIINVKIIQ
ncbi:MAG: PPC domain-containing protein [Candidatus Poribacteria bacterium]|nr:PPC domain-containing protein [Candidatus Poribacteria bacterium]